MTDDLLRDLGKELPWDRPDAARRDAVRSSLLVGATEGRRPGTQRRWLVVGGAFAAGVLAAATVALVVRHPTAVESLGAPSAAQITASSQARLEQRVVATSTGVDEIVHVHDGTVRLAVDQVRAGDHVRLRTQNAEVEGAGEYEVVVVAEILNAVTVRTGSARITVDGQQTVVLATGQTWHASIITTDLTPARDRVAVAANDVPKPTAAPTTVDNPTADATAVQRSDATVTSSIPNRTSNPTASSVASQSVRSPDNDRDTAIATSSKTTDRAPATARTPDPATEIARDGSPARPNTTATGATRAQSPIERHFQAGWALLRGGKAKEAAVELGVAADAQPDDPLAVDARYFQAVALVRAGQRPEAEKVLLAFLDHAPRSLRRGRAAVLLGRLIAERGDVASARAWLSSAEHDADPAIALAARAGLAALAHPKR